MGYDPYRTPDEPPVYKESLLHKIIGFVAHPFTILCVGLLLIGSMINCVAQNERDRKANEPKCLEWKDWKHVVNKCTQEVCRAISSGGHSCYCGRYENVEVNDPFCVKWNKDAGL